MPIREDESKKTDKRASSGLSSGLIPIAAEKSTGGLKKEGRKPVGLS